MQKPDLTRRDLLRWSALASATLLNPLRSPFVRTRTLVLEEATDTFAGPFASWSDLRTKYGARGDGVADDTAALQAGLDALGDEKNSPVLWIPAGTYRLTKTLNWTRNIGDGWMSILGQDPAATRIVWDGEPDGIMFQTHNVNNSRFGRITWDGQNRASCAVQHTSSGSSSGNEHADEAFENVGVGIRGGTMDTKMVAEMSVLRCHFAKCSRAGISVENPNSLDWWIWHSLFEDCYAGVTSGYGQGSFQVFNSVFKRSTFADMFINFASYHVLADNYSINSRAFCLSPFSWNQLELVIQRNTILDPTLGPNPPEPPDGGLAELFPYDLSGPIAAKYYGPMLLLDNVIRSRPGQRTPVVEIGEDMLAAGNTFTVSNPFSASKRLIQFDNTIRDAKTVLVDEPTLPMMPPPFTGKIFEVAPNATAAQIQTQIDAATAAGNRAVVHLPYGTYRLAQRIVISPNSDIQIIGDGRSWLDWNGAATGTAFDVSAPVHATLRDFVLRQNENQATGIHITGFNQTNARVLMQGVQVRGSTHGLNVEGLDDALIELRDFSSTNANFTPPIATTRTAVNVSGGAKRRRGELVGGRVNWFSGASSGTVPSYGVAGNGALLVRAVWYEGAASTIAYLKGAGEFTLLGSLMARAAETKSLFAAIEIDSFAGQVAILSSNFADAEKLPLDAVAVRVQGLESKMRVLVLGVCGWTGRLMNLENKSPNAEVGFFMNRSTHQVRDYVLGRADEYKGSDAAPYTRLLREMLLVARREKPLAAIDPAIGVTDLRMNRVYVFGFETAIHFEG